MTYQYVAVDMNGKEVNGVVSAINRNVAIAEIKTLGHSPIKINEIKENSMNLAQALKQKNRLAGELVRQQQILQRENARRNDSVSKVDRDAVFQQCLKLSDELGELKGKITVANIGIYPALERMAELKSRIGFLNGLPKRDGEEIIPLHGDRAPLTYTWESFINQEKCDAMVLDLQVEINKLQDQVDIYNSTTSLP